VQSYHRFPLSSHTSRPPPHVHAFDRPCHAHTARDTQEHSTPLAARRSQEHRSPLAARKNTAHRTPHTSTRRSHTHECTKHTNARCMHLKASDKNVRARDEGGLTSAETVFKDRFETAFQRYGGERVHIVSACVLLCASVLSQCATRLCMCASVRMACLHMCVHVFLCVCCLSVLSYHLQQDCCTHVFYVLTSSPVDLCHFLHVSVGVHSPTDSPACLSVCVLPRFFRRSTAVWDMLEEELWKARSVDERSHQHVL
jgi:hypothetical protein